MKKIAELIYEAYSRGQRKKDIVFSETYDKVEKAFLQSLNKEQWELYRNYELELLNANTEENVKLIEYIISLLTIEY